jgi:hypothetical protein
MSCYVKYFTAEEAHTRKTRGRLEAACGRFVDYPREHSAEPTCDTPGPSGISCQRWLEQDAADTRTADELFGEIPHEQVYVDDESMSTKEAK